MDFKSFLGGITPEEFLSEYWCKKPLLIKGAIKNAEGFLTVDNMRELALEESAESRMVLRSSAASCLGGATSCLGGATSCLGFFGSKH